MFASAVKRSYGCTRTSSLTDVLVLKYVFLFFSVQSTTHSATVGGNMPPYSSLRLDLVSTR